MRIKILLLVVSCLSLPVQARITPSWTYAMLSEDATVIVVATPLQSGETREQTTLPDIETVFPDGRTEKVSVIGMETTFEVLTVLKGPKKIAHLTLHHFKLAEGEELGRGSPEFVAFNPKDAKRFLMFLKREVDGRYVAVTGQTDPDDSIKELVGNYP